MKIFNLPRAAGKSMRMVYASEFNNAPILCANPIMKDHLKCIAKKYGIKIPEPITVSELNKLYNVTDVLVDDIPINEISNKNINIIGYAFSDEKNKNICRFFNDDGYIDEPIV